MSGLSTVITCKRRVRPAKTSGSWWTRSPSASTGRARTSPPASDHRSRFIVHPTTLAGQVDVTPLRLNTRMPPSLPWESSQKSAIPRERDRPGGAQARSIWRDGDVRGWRQASLCRRIHALCRSSATPRGRCRRLAAFSKCSSRVPLVAVPVQSVASAARIVRIAR